MKKLILSSVSLLILFITMPHIAYAQTSQPIAKFTFDKQTYQQSETITFSDESYSPLGLEIIRHEWKIVTNGKEKTSASLNTLLRNVNVGPIIVYMRVKDSKGTWSQWTYGKMTIVEDIPFTITSFTPRKNIYKIGEKLQLDYTYTNINDLLIKGQRWRYKNLTTGGHTISSKPKYFKKEGVYEVSLELCDEWGNWSNKVTCNVTVSNAVVDRTGHYLFEQGEPGDLIDGYIDYDYNEFKSSPILSVTDIPGTLIMSNSPESVLSSGILYQDTVSGIGRLLVHHRNGTEYHKKLMIFASTPDTTSATLTLFNQAIIGPNKHVLQAGREAVSQYLKGGQTQSYTIGPNDKVCIYDSKTKGSWQNGMTISGTMDFKAVGNITFQVVVMDEWSTIENVSKLNVLSRDIHNRGTFDTIERQYVLDLSDIKESAKLVLGKEQSEWLKGIDALTGDEIYNKGNYGLPIKIKVKTNKDIGVVANARGGQILGALKWNNSKIFNMPNEDVLSSKTVAALVGLMKASTTNEITYMLPNGSSAPILFGFIPKNEWK